MKNRFDMLLCSLCELGTATIETKACLKLFIACIEFEKKDQIKTSAPNTRIHAFVKEKNMDL